MFLPTSVPLTQWVLHYVTSETSPLKSLRGSGFPPTPTRAVPHIVLEPPSGLAVDPNKEEQVREFRVPSCWMFCSILLMAVTRLPFSFLHSVLHKTTPVQCDEQSISQINDCWETIKLLLLLSSFCSPLSISKLAISISSSSFC